MHKRKRFKRADKNGTRLHIGDMIRVTEIHPKIVNHGEFKTRTILNRAVGRIFPVVGFQRDWIELALGKLIRKKAWEEAVWVEPEFIELVEQKKTKVKVAKVANRKQGKKRKRVLK